jgi:translation initiation factor IF-3
MATLSSTLLRRQPIRFIRPSCSYNTSLSFHPTVHKQKQQQQQQQQQRCGNPLGSLFHSYARNIRSAHPVFLHHSPEFFRCTLKLRLGATSCHQVRSLSTTRKQNKANDENAPLLNEHLIAQLLTHDGKKGSNEISAETYEVRLIIDVGGNKKCGKQNKEDVKVISEETSTPASQIVTISEAIKIAHQHSLDLMEVSLQQDPPVIKALDFERFLYQQKRKQSKTKDIGGGAISDKPVKEFKFRAGIADHDLERKASNMIEYLTKGHAIRVTLTARQRSLNEDAQAIRTTLERVKDLVGDKAVEVRGMKSNDRGSYGNLLLHPNLKK